MQSGLSPEIALDPPAFTQLYEEAMGFEEREERLEVSFVLLTMGRLGLRPAEVIHLHEGWLDWPAGALQVPAFDSCACQHCWQQAKRTSHQHRGKQVDEIVAETCWSPGEGQARSLSFGWSNRLTGSIGTFFAANEYLAYEVNGLRQLLFEIASKTELQLNWLSPEMLRSSALSFLAAAGCSEEILVELTGVDAATAGEFVSDSTDQHTGHSEADFPLISDTQPIAGEPFEPNEFDSDWRIQRGVQAEETPENPRPVVTPNGISLSAEALVESQEIDTDPETTVVATDLDGWIQALTEEYTESDGQASATESQSSAEQADDEVGSSEDDGGEADEQDAAVTEIIEPVDFAIDTRFAADSKPTGGKVILTREALLLLSRSDSGVDGILQIDWESIEDLAPGYAPEKIANHFDETIGLAYSDESVERRIVVWEVPEDIQSDFTRQLFTYILDDMKVVVSGIKRDSERLMGEKMQITVADETLEFSQPNSERVAELPLASVLEVDEADMTQTTAGGTGLELYQLSDGNRPTKAKIQAPDQRKQKLLQRLLLLHLNPKQRKSKELNLGGEHREVLTALYKTEPGQSFLSVVDMDASRLVGIVNVLKSNGLVRDCASGIKLTSTGFLALRGDSQIDQT